MKIVLDVFGGDNAPRQIIAGAIEAVKKFNDITIVLVGNEEIVKAELAHFNFSSDRFEFINSNTVVSNNESPTMAIKTKKDSSLVVGLEYTRDNDEVVGFVSAGSTGAVLTGALLKVGRIPGVLRPALAPPLPNNKNGYTLLIDCGANMDSKPEYLTQFAILGSIYMEKMFGTKNPRVALLNVGVEDKKGNDLTHQAFELLKDMKGINFVGNMEARDILSGDYDVVVADGFAGNVALKSLEGTANFIFKALKSGIQKGGLFAKIGALFLKPTLKKIAKKMDYNAVGGSVFLGVNKIVVKSHGSSDANSILGSISLVREVHLSNFISGIKAQLEIQKNE